MASAQQPGLSTTPYLAGPLFAAAVLLWGSLLGGSLLGGSRLHAQSLPPLPTPPTPSIAGSDAAPTTVHAPNVAHMPEVQGTPIDRVDAIVNNDLVLDSDVDQERRLDALIPLEDHGEPYSRDAAIQRLINRALILQQIQIQPQAKITDEAATKDLDALRKNIVACKQFQCETKAGWDRFLATENFTEPELVELWRQRMEVLAFIQQRFQMGVRITSKQIQDYYNEKLKPQYAAQHKSAPPLANISDRVQNLLLQQQVSGLLDDWLKSLRAQGQIVVLHPGEVAP